MNDKHTGEARSNVSSLTCSTMVEDLICLQQCGASPWPISATITHIRPALLSKHVGKGLPVVRSIQEGKRYRHGCGAIVCNNEWGLLSATSSWKTKVPHVSLKPNSLHSSILPLQQLQLTPSFQLALQSPLQKPHLASMSGTSSVGNSTVYEAGDQRNAKNSEEGGPERYNEGVSNSHKPNDSSMVC